MIKSVTINNKTIKMKASAATPRLYRELFKRDIFIDYEKLISKEEDIEHMTVFENMAYTMAKQADSTIPDSIEDWLDGFDDIYSICEILPTIIELWNGNLETHSEAQKKTS